MTCMVCHKEYSNPSFGGPGICPSCDCGIPPKKESDYTPAALPFHRAVDQSNYPDSITNIPCFCPIGKDHRVDEAALALSSADSSGSDNVPLPKSEGEQPTSVGRLKWLLTYGTEQALKDELTTAYDEGYTDGLARGVEKLAEERRQAKIEELERFQYEFGLIDTPQPDWEGTIDQRVYDRLTELRGENNED